MVGFFLDRKAQPSLRMAWFWKVNSLCHAVLGMSLLCPAFMFVDNMLSSQLSWFCLCAACPDAGCTHFIVGRDMAGSKSSITGDDFYGMYDAQVRPQYAAVQ